MTKRRLERERGRRDATADMSEDLSEGERGDTVSDISAHDGHRSRMPRISSTDVLEAWASQHKEKKLYIVLIRHGTVILLQHMCLLYFHMVRVFYWRYIPSFNTVIVHHL